MVMTIIITTAITPPIMAVTVLSDEELAFGSVTVSILGGEVGSDSVGPVVSSGLVGFTGDGVSEGVVMDTVLT